MGGLYAERGVLAACAAAKLALMLVKKCVGQGLAAYDLLDEEGRKQADGGGFCGYVKNLNGAMESLRDALGLLLDAADMAEGREGMDAEDMNDPARAELDRLARRWRNIRDRYALLMRQCPSGKPEHWSVSLEEMQAVREYIEALERAAAGAAAS